MAWQQIYAPTWVKDLRLKEAPSLSSDEQQRLLEVISALPDEPWLERRDARTRTVDEVYKVVGTPTDGMDGTPTFWLNTSQIKALREDVVILVGVYAMTRNLDLTAIATLLAKLRKVVRRLRDEELEVVRRIARQCGGDIYGMGAPEQVLLAAWPDEDRLLLERLDNMRERKILRKEGDYWLVT